MALIRGAGTRISMANWFWLIPEGSAGKPTVYGVGFEPERIRKASPSPADFDEFWSDAKRKLDETTPVDTRLERISERCTDKIAFYRISVASYKGRVWGWLSVPSDASETRKYPVRVEVPGAGKGRWAHDMTPESDAICMKMTAHAFPLAFDDETFLRQYADLEKSLLEKYGVPSYAIAGLGKSREEFYYYRAFLGISRAVDWIAAQPYVDVGSITYSGTSQGGGFGLALLAINRHFTKGALFVPALSDNMAPYLIGRRSGCGPCHIFGDVGSDPTWDMGPDPTLSRGYMGSDPTWDMGSDPALTRGHMGSDPASIKKLPAKKLPKSGKQARYRLARQGMWSDPILQRQAAAAT